MKRMTKVLALIFVLAALFSLLAMPAAASTEDSTYSQYLYYTNGFVRVDERSKETYSKVYVHPINSPNGITNVQTWGYSSVNGSKGSATNYTKATTVFLSSGEYYAVGNNIRENGYTNSSTGTSPCFLKIKPNYGNGLVKGDWSPDWSGNTSYGNKTIIIK